MITQILELPDDLKLTFQQNETQISSESNQDKANALTAKVKSNLRIPDKQISQNLSPSELVEQIKPLSETIVKDVSDLLALGSIP